MHSDTNANGAYIHDYWLLEKVYQVTPVQTCLSTLIKTPCANMYVHINKNKTKQKL